MKAAGAGGAYFLVVFACGLVLGAIRTLFVVPAIGELNATLIELPFMLAISWSVAQWLVARMAAPATIAERLAMGVTAFALLMAAEFALGNALGRPLGDQWQGLLEPAGLVGLAGQIVFALMPLLIMRSARRREDH